MIFCNLAKKNRLISCISCICALSGIVGSNGCMVHSNVGVADVCVRLLQQTDV